MSRSSSSVLTVGIVALVLGASLVGTGVVLGDAGIGDQTRRLGGSEAGSSGRTITVSASGDAETEPDKAIVRVSVEATADDPTVARQRVATNASSMRRALVDLGLDEGAIRTVDFDIYEDRLRPPEPDARPRTTYRARHSFAIEVSDIDQVGAVIDTAVDRGATSVHGVEFTLSAEARGELQREALGEAMSNARDQADALAGSAGLTITDVRTARTGSTSGPRPVPMLASGDGGSAGGTSIDSGPVTVAATVTVSYNASA